MSTAVMEHTGAAAPVAGVASSWRTNPVAQAFWLLRIGFTVAPIVFGLDKFAHVLVNWDRYLAPQFARVLPGTTHELMYIVGVIEIAAGILVAAVPRLGAFVVSAWLMGIVVNLLLPPGFYDIALRDFGLSLAACALGLLAKQYGRPLWKAFRVS